MTKARATTKQKYEVRFWDKAKAARGYAKVYKAGPYLAMSKSDAIAQAKKQFPGGLKFTALLINPHSSFTALSTARIKKAARVEAKGKAITKVGAKRKDAHLMQKGMRMSRRGLLSGEGGEQKGGTHTLGPVGRLPNPANYGELVLIRIEHERPSGKGWAVYDKYENANGIPESKLVEAATVARNLGKRFKYQTRLVIKRAGKGLQTIYQNPTPDQLRKELDQVDRDIAELETDPFYRETPGRRAYARKWLAHHRRQRREIERLIKRRKNGIVDIAAGMQALDYLGSKVRGRKRKNPSVTAIADKFQGEANGDLNEYYAADSAPKNLARAGKLVFLKVAGKQIRLPNAMVAIAPNEKLWITGKHALFATKAKKGEGLDMGEVSHICYRTAKAHIENAETVEYVHEFGEDGGKRPHLIIDHEGMPILRGGDYKIRAEGIIN